MMWLPHLTNILGKQLEAGIYQKINKSLIPNAG